LWYICSLLQCCLSLPVTAIDKQGSESYIESASCARFSHIMGKTLSGTKWNHSLLGDLEKEMLLALCERFWLVGKATVTLNPPDPFLAKYKIQ